MSTEKDLFLLVKNSDEKAFEILFRLYYQPLKSYATNIIEDNELAEGIVQEVFINLWENRNKLENTAPKAYLYQLVKNRALNKIRHQKVKNKYTEEILHTENEWIDEELDHEDLVAKIYMSIDKLPAQCKKVFIMSRMHGLKHKEIAEDLNISIKTVKNQVGKALKILRKDLNGINITLIISLLKILSEKF